MATIDLRLCRSLLFLPASNPRAIEKARKDGYCDIFVGYADCGTGGALDRVCEKHGVKRIAGPHCFAFYQGMDRFEKIAEADMTAFYMTDFLCRHFETFFIRPLGLDRHPELATDYFGNYEKLVYLAQTDDPELDRVAESAASMLGLAYERRFTGYGDLQGGSNEDLWYTDTFSGTSSASPIVVAALACTQGVLKARGHRRLTSDAARRLVRTVQPNPENENSDFHGIGVRVIR
jgi:hypothetical protein